LYIKIFHRQKKNDWGNYTSVVFRMYYWFVTKL
jgi:hypothetical protein